MSLVITLVISALILLYMECYGTVFTGLMFLSLIMRNELLR